MSMEAASDLEFVAISELAEAWADRVPTMFALWIPELDDRSPADPTDKVNCCLFHSGKFQTTLPPHIQDSVEEISQFLRGVTNANSA